MAIGTTPVQQATGSGASGASSVTISIGTVGAGNLGVVEWGYVNTNATLSSITQTNVSNWTQACEEHATRSVAIQYAENLPGTAGTTITANLSASTTSSSYGVNYTEWSGVATSSSAGPADAQPGASSVTATTPTITPTAGQNALIIGVIRQGGNKSTGPNSSNGTFTALTSPTGDSTRWFGAYQVVASTSGSYDWNNVQGAANTFGGAIASFYAAGGGGGGATPAPGVGVLTLNGLAPTIVTPQTVAPGVGSATLTGLAPTIVTPQSVTPGVGALTLSGFAPTILSGTTLAPGVGVLTLTGFAPTALTPQSVTAGVGALTVTGFAPTALTPQTVTPGVGVATLTGFAPTVLTPRVVLPGVGSVAVTGFAPTAIGVAPALALPGVGALLVTGFVPTIINSTPVTVDGIPQLLAEYRDRSPSVTVWDRSIAPRAKDKSPAVLVKDRATDVLVFTRSTLPRATVRE